MGFLMRDRSPLLYARSFIACNEIWQAGASSVHNGVDDGMLYGNGMKAVEESFSVAAPLVVLTTSACRSLFLSQA